MFDKFEARTKKAIKIIRSEGLSVFTGKLARRIVYGMVNAVKAKSMRDIRSSRQCRASEIGFIEKKSFSDKEIKDGGVRLTQFFSEAKADILKTMNIKHL